LFSPKQDEIVEILSRNKPYKTPGIDKVEMDLLKHLPQVGLHQFLSILCKAWVSNDVPEEWKTSIQILIPKIPRPKSVDDYRRISLCSSGYKVYAKWLLTKLQIFIPELPDYQAAFIHNRSCDDHLFVLRRIMDEHWRHGKELFLGSIDLKKAFDTIDTSMLGGILKSYEVPHHLINRILHSCVNELTCIRWCTQTTNTITKGKGIKQGCPLSPFLFNLILHEVLKSTKRDVRELSLEPIDEIKIPMVLAYADDLLFLTENENDLGEILIEMTKNLKSVGLEINQEKSGVLLRDPLLNIPRQRQFIYGNITINYTKEIKYLGSILTNGLSRPKIMKSRLKQAMKINKTLLPFLRTVQPSKATALKIYTALLTPVMTYGAKTTALTKSNRSDARRYERRILYDMMETTHDYADESTDELLQGNLIEQPTSPISNPNHSPFSFLSIQYIFHRHS
jgi:hypothetical protein